MPPPLEVEVKSFEAVFDDPFLLSCREEEEDRRKRDRQLTPNGRITNHLRFTNADRLRSEKK